MDVPHFAGYIAEDRIDRSDAFWELNGMLDFDVQLSPTMPEFELKVSVKNILNRFQDNFDRGVDRDAGYIYGNPRAPSRPSSPSLHWLEH